MFIGGTVKKKYLQILLLLPYFFILISCGEAGDNRENETSDTKNYLYAGDLEIVKDYRTYRESADKNPDMEFVDLEKIMPGLILDIRYATENNFTGEVIYSQAKAYLRKPVAEALKKVRQDLLNEGIDFKIFDAYRPYQATVKFYEVYRDTLFVAAPWKGSVHNRGCAVDLTLIDKASGKELPMPTPFDDFSKKASHEYDSLPQNLLENRRILREAMEGRGFEIYSHEWWHYNFGNYEDFPITDLSFEELEGLPAD